jgi:hypothetical protein
MNIIIADQLTVQLQQEGIRIEEIQQVLENAERTNKKVINPKTGSITTHLTIGMLTLWVEYILEKTDALIKTVYYHRIQIEEETKNGK